MKFLWVADQVMNNEFDVQWHLGKETLQIFFTKYFDTKTLPQRTPMEYARVNLSKSTSTSGSA